MLISIADMDFIDTSAVLTFNASMSLQCGQVTIRNDNVCEIDETFFVQLESSDGGVNISLNVATVTITDDDDCSEYWIFWPSKMLHAVAWLMLNILFLSTVIRLQDAQYSINEQVGTVTVCAVLDGESEEDLHVTWSTLSGTAIG